MHTTAIALICIGVAGVAQFASLAFAGHQLDGIAIPRLQRRLAHPLAKHATPLALVSTLVLIVGLVLPR